MTQLRSLLTGMASNSFKQLSASTERTTGMANALPRTLVDFDGVATDGTGTWASNAAVNQNVMAGVGAISTPNMWGFSGGAMSDDGYGFFFGGGHDGSGDGSFYGFDPEKAATLVNQGSAGTWDLLVPSGRWLDAFTHTQPAWSPQPTITPTPTGTHQSYYVTTNKNGTEMPAVCHSYHSVKALPGTRTFLISGNFVYDANGQPGLGKPWYYDATNNIVGGPLTPTDNTGGDHPTTVYGYGQPNEASGGVCAVCPASDGTVYCPGGQASAYGWFLIQYTNPINSSTITQNTTPPFYQVADPVGLHNDGIVIVDPNDASDYIMFLHGRTSSGGFSDTHFVVANGLKGHTLNGAYNFQSYLSGTVTTNGNEFLHYAYDSSRKVIWMTDGEKLFKITPSASLTSWTIAQVTGFTGDVPPTPSSLEPVQPTKVVPCLQYVAAHDCLIHIQYADVRLYKPSGWSPPADVVAAQPYQPWYQAAPVLAQ